MLPRLHLQNLLFSESGMEVVSIQENYFRNSSFKEFSLIEKICEPRVETPESTSSVKVVWKLFQSKKIIFAILALKNFH